jgi:membrane-bound inhibitor of C-type lysozyme
MSETDKIHPRMNRSFPRAKNIGRSTFVTVIMALLSSCSSSDYDGERSWLSFRCPDGRTVMARFERQDGFVSVRFADTEWRLPHVISGSGARYGDGKTTFWNKGNDALLEVDDKIVVQDCALQGERLSQSTRNLADTKSVEPAAG